MEYLVLTGFTMLILMILLVAAYTRISASEKQLDMDAAERAVSRLKEAADFVYIHGHPTKLVVSVYFPDDVDPAQSFIENKTVNLAVDVEGSHSDVWRTLRGDVAWDLDGTSEMPWMEGYYSLTVESTAYGPPHNGSINIHE